jgi:glutamate-ammonia-ligase adenylyltransferase
MDIELAAETVALITSEPARAVERQIAAGAGSVLSEPDAQTLLDAYNLMWRLHSAARLLTDGVPDPGQLGEGGRAFLLREAGAADLAGLAARLEALAAQAGAVIEAFVGAIAEAGDAAE